MNQQILPKIKMELKTEGLKQSVRQSDELVFDERSEEAKLASRERKAHVEGVENYYRLRSKWSRYSVVFISVMLAFQIILTGLIGFKILEFQEYKTFLAIVIGENFAQIVGMGIIVVTFLFPVGESKKKK